MQRWHLETGLSQKFSFVFIGAIDSPRVLWNGIAVPQHPSELSPLPIWKGGLQGGWQRSALFKKS